GVARNGTAISGRAIRCMGKPPIMRSRLHAPELRAAERFGSAALSGSCQRSARGRHARIPEHLPIALERGVRPARLRREVPGNAAVPASAPHQADAHIDRHLAPVDDDRLRRAREGRIRADHRWRDATGRVRIDGRAFARACFFHGRLAGLDVGASLAITRNASGMAALGGKVFLLGPIRSFPLAPATFDRSLVRVVLAFEPGEFLLVSLASLLGPAARGLVLGHLPSRELGGLAVEPRRFLDLAALLLLRLAPLPLLGLAPLPFGSLAALPLRSLALLGPARRFFGTRGGGKLVPRLPIESCNVGTLLDLGGRCFRRSRLGLLDGVRGRSPCERADDRIVGAVHPSAVLGPGAGLVEHRAPLAAPVVELLITGNYRRNPDILVEQTADISSLVIAGLGGSNRERLGHEQRNVRAGPAASLERAHDPARLVAGRYLCPGGRNAAPRRRQHTEQPQPCNAT